MARPRKRQPRRDFLKTSAVLGGGYFIAPAVAWSAPETPTLPPRRSANEAVRLACIGVGGKGGSDTDQAAALCDVVALCDCDANTLGKKAEKFEGAKKYSDFRKLFDEVGKNIDAVTISTPDHTHAPAAMRALRQGIATYVQKPLTHTVFEARQLRTIANEKKIATQMGNQGSAADGIREAIEVLQSGAIGPIREAHIWTNRPIWPQAPQVMSRPEGEDPVPDSLNWDAFLGPAPMRPYKAGVYHPFKWRGWWDFGTGALGDMGCHTANMAFRALKLGYPTTIEAKAGDVNDETCPGVATVTFEFPAREDMPPCKVVWYEGKVPDLKGELVKNLPPEELLQGRKPTNSGSLIVGDKGTLYSPDDYGAKYEFLGTGFEDYKPPKPTLPRIGGGDPAMKKEWIEAIRGGPKPYSNFDVAGLLTEFILLGNVAIRTGKKLEWDGPNCQVTNCPEAARFVNKEYRKGWEL
jgi:predicted dehydrogenase